MKDVGMAVDGREACRAEGHCAAGNCGRSASEKRPIEAPPCDQGAHATNRNGEASARLSMHRPRFMWQWVFEAQSNIRGYKKTVSCMVDLLGLKSSERWVTLVKRPV